MTGIKRAIGPAFLLVCFLYLLPQIASAQVAPGVTQSAAHTAVVRGTVTDSNGKPVAGADVGLNGPSLLSTKSDSRGTFEFRSVPWGRYQLVVFSTVGVAERDDIAINGDITVSIQYQPTSNLKTIANVSTSGSGAHINVTSSSIASVEPGAYAFQGNTTWQQLFSQVPGVAVSGYISSAGTLSAVPGNPQAPVVLSLNGALPYETATTLDGMPMQGTSPTEQYSEPGGGVDLSMLPLNAFETADVVRGPGANAPSIVDSIGGSFVLHGPGSVDRDSFMLSTSNDQYGGISSNAKLALHLGRLSATLIYGVNDSPGPLGTSAVMPSSPQQPLSIDGHAVQGPTVSIGPNPPGYTDCYCTIKDTLLTCCIQQSTSWTQNNGAVGLSYSMGPAITAQVFYAGTTSRANTQGGYYPVEFSPSSSTPSYTGGLEPSPPGQTTYTLLDTFGASVYSAASSLLEEKLTAFVGTGVLRFAALQYNTFDYEDVPTAPPDGLYRLWGTANVGGKYPGTPTAYNGTLEPLTFSQGTVDYRTWVNNRDLLGSYGVQIGSNSSASLSYVTSYVNDPYSFVISANGTPTYSVANAPSVSETTDETRVHLDTSVSDKLSVGLSWYFAQAGYHVPKTSMTPGLWTDSIFRYNAPRLGLVWRANPDIAIRAAAGGGFALPQIENLAGQPLSYYNGQYSVITGNPNLKPEQTFGFDVGTDMRIHHDVALSLDLYRTNLYGQFFQSNTESFLNGKPLFTEEFGNLGTSRFQGINVAVHRDVTHGYYWRGSLGLTRGYVVSVSPEIYNNPSIPCTKCANQFVIPGPNFNGAYAAVVPYASASGSLGYRWTPDKYLDLTTVYYGNNNQYLTPHAFATLDAHAGYAITKNVSILATARNLTGAYDESVQIYRPSYAIPAIPGAAPLYPGAVLQETVGPRALIFTVVLRAGSE